MTLSNRTPELLNALPLAKKLQRLPDTNKAHSGLSGPIGMTPSELILEIRQVLNNLL
jgi:hypothetical protein